MDQKESIKILKSLANPRRLQTIFHLRQSGVLNVSAIAEKLKLSFRSASKHLLNLENAGLVERTQQSREVFYRLSSNFSKIIKDTLARMSE